MLFQHIKLPLQENLILPELPENIFLINKIFCMWKSCRIYAFHSFMALVPTQSLSLMFLLLFISLQEDIAECGQYPSCPEAKIPL